LLRCLGKLKLHLKKKPYAALNGVIGDYLEKTENPLQLTMEVRHNGNPIHIAKKNLQNTFPDSSGKILLMVHGSCMSALQWTRKEHNHGASLAETFNLTPIYLNYNSGLHVSTNGQELNELLENLILQWPSPVEELQIIAHSMGGLVARSAIYYGQQQKNSWTKYLSKAIFLGTPHHGASLEKAGNYLEAVLEAVPYAKPFARLGKIRSAGVTDLRYGSILDEDWQDIDQYKIRGDQRDVVPLPKGVECYSVAGVVGKKTTSSTTRLLGDTMVGLKSALGEHKISEKKLKFKKKNTFIAYETNHLDLLSNPEVYAKLKEWVVAPATK
jgi:pimeloyl-ACP methyl ester carboxylesterase